MSHQVVRRMWPLSDTNLKYIVALLPPKVAKRVYPGWQKYVYVIRCTVYAWKTSCWKLTATCVPGFIHILHSYIDILRLSQQSRKTSATIKLYGKTWIFCSVSAIILLTSRLSQGIPNKRMGKMVFQFFPPIHDSLGKVRQLLNKNGVLCI